MYLRRFSAWAVMLGALAGAAPVLAVEPALERSASGCPAHLTENGKFHMLVAMKVHDGKPDASNLVLPAVQGKISVWDIAAIRAAGGMPVVECAFRHTGKVFTGDVPKTATQCQFTNSFPAQSLCQ